MAVTAAPPASAPAAQAPPSSKAVSAATLARSPSLAARTHLPSAPLPPMTTPAAAGTSATSAAASRMSLLRTRTATSTVSSAGAAPSHASGTTPPQPIDFPYTGSSIRPFLSTSFKTSAERGFSGGPDAARFREPTQTEPEEEVEDDDMADHPHPPQDPETEGVFTFSSPYLGSKALGPEPHPSARSTSTVDTAKGAAASKSAASATELHQRVMSPAWAATSLGRMTLGSPDIRPSAGTSPLPTLSSLGPSSSALGTSPVTGPSQALAQRRLSNHRAPTMRDVYGTGSPSSAAGLYGVSPASAASRLSSSLPAASGFGVLPGTSPSSGASAARRISHTRPSRPGLATTASQSGAPASATRQGPYSRPSHGPNGSTANRSHSRNRLSFSQQGKDGVDRNNSGLGLLGAAALADAASPPFALRPTRTQSSKVSSIVDTDVDGIDFAMEDIEGPFVGDHKREHPSSSDVEDSDLDDDDDVRDEMMLSLVNEVDDAEATEDESEEIKEHIRTSGASSYTNPGPGMGLLAQMHTLGGVQRTGVRSVPTAISGRPRASRHSIGTGTSIGFQSPSSLGLNFREAHGHAPHQPYPNRGLGHQPLGHASRSPRLGGHAELEAAFPPQKLSSSPIYSASVPTSAALHRQLSAEQQQHFNHASALAAMRHYPYGSSPGVTGVRPPVSSVPSGSGHRRSYSAQTTEEDEGASDFGGEPSSVDAADVSNASATRDTTGTSLGETGVDENAEVAMIRDRLGGAAHCSAFISKLWYLLINPALYSRYIRWSEAGDSIILSNDADISAEFANDVLPKLFKHGNNASFIRQLNLYGFQRVPSSRLLDAAEQKAAAQILKGTGGPTLSSNAAIRSSSRTRGSDAGLLGASAASPSSPPSVAPMTTALHLYGPHSSFAHPSFRRGQESLLPSMKPRSSKKPKGAKAAGNGAADGASKAAGPDDGMAAQDMAGYE